MVFMAPCGSERRRHREQTHSVIQPGAATTCQCVGGQWLGLVFDASSANTIVFVKEKGACVPSSLKACYSYKNAEAQGSLHICLQEKGTDCRNLEAREFTCDNYLKDLDKAKPHKDSLIIDGLQYDQEGVEAKDDVLFSFSEGDTPNISSAPIRLLVEPMAIPSDPSPLWLSLQLFAGASGVLGGSGPSLSCRKRSAWSILLEERQASLFALDLQPPPNATIKDPPGQSYIAIDEINPSYEGHLVWSQPKQVGDLINDGMHEFLLYHPEVCGVDLLYNTSSNWLTVIDTSGPCLTLPPFLFDRLRTRVSLDCPFKPGEKSLGRLCSPKRFPGAKGPTLPPLHFALEDVQDPEPPRLHLALERLVFRNGSGTELLCVARGDTYPQAPTADMTYAHIALGSLALAGLYTVVNLENSTVGLASKGRLEADSTEEFCVPSVSCPSPMQTYFPPLNMCEDPRCSEYMFMMLDERTKTCKWTRTVPISFGILLFVLVVLDFVSHRLYKQAIEKASEFGQ